MFNKNIMIFITTKVILIILLQDLNFSKTKKRKTYKRDFFGIPRRKYNT